MDANNILQAMKYTLEKHKEAYGRSIGALDFRQVGSWPPHIQILHEIVKLADELDYED